MTEPEIKDCSNGQPVKVTSGNKTFWGMAHLNGNLLCALDVETTGFDLDMHGIIEIAIVPLNAQIEPHEHFPLFHMRMKPDEGEEIDQDAIRVNGVDLAQIILEGHQRDSVADYLMNWFDALHLPGYKKIIPLACNWPFDRSMIERWLGKASFEHIFHPHYRDIQPVANYLNDCADARAEAVDFPKVSLQYLCNLLKVPQLKAHTAISDCIATAQIYKKLLSFRPGLL